MKAIYVLVILMLAAAPALSQDKPEPVPLWVAPEVPADIQAAARRLVRGGHYAPAEDAASAAVRVELSAAPDAEGLRWAYAVAVPFFAINDAVHAEDIRRFWEGEHGALSYVTNAGRSPTLVMGAQTAAAMQVLWGAPEASPLVDVVPEEAVRAAVWEHGASWALVPFHRLEPALKVLAVDGVDLLDPRADLGAYPFAVTVTFSGEAAARARADLALVGGWAAQTNRDPDRMTVLAMTGVTALTRNTSRTMEEEGVLYPARDVVGLLRSADVLHINNEVPFAEDCPFPEFYEAEITFCAKPGYFDLLEYVGADVIELTGNHAKDWGEEAFLLSMQMYEDASMGTFGGGRTLEDAARPLVVEHNGNTIGFLGCNPVGPVKAWATDAQGGAMPCGDYEGFLAAVTDLTRAVDVVVVTQQFWEIESRYPDARQLLHFDRLARAGADIVSGSQAHVAKGFAFSHGALIHYGLGNLFFDQMYGLDVRRLFIDRHIIYNGRHISTALFTGMLEDYARPRPMTEEERFNFLWTVFDGSQW